MNKRKPYIDTIKALAIFVVFLTHFIDEFHPEYFSLWKTLPTAILLKGVSGKFGVCVFSVILGYFAFKTKETNIAKYAVKRYVYFLVCGLFINSVYAVFSRFGLFSDPISTYKVLKTSVLLGSDIFPTFWCIRPFMYASLITAINKKLRSFPTNIAIIIVEIALLVYVGQLWVAICLIGNVVAIVEHSDYYKKVFSNRSIRISVYLISFIAIKFANYLLDGISAALVLLALGCSPVLSEYLRNRLLASIGKNTMAIYLTHVIIYEAIGKVLITDTHFVASFVFAMLVSWIVIVAFSYPATAILNKASSVLNKLIDRLFDYFDFSNKEAETA